MVKDLALYLSIIAISSLIFLPLHVVAIRVRHGAKLITTLNTTICVSAMVGVAAGWWILGDEFTSEGARLLACVGGGLTFLGYAGVYALIGPISVDRSVSSHIVELVYLAPGHRLAKADLFKLYSHADVLEKRFNDCIETGIIERRGDELTVTRRGARIALIYMFLGALLSMPLWYLKRYREGDKSDKS